MDLQLQGSVAIVVGGAQGIGQAIASEFAAEKAHVAVIDRSSLVEECGREMAHRHGVRVRAFQCDATDEVALGVVARSVIQDLGRCDHVVYAAGVGSGKFGFPFWNLDPADWPGVLEVNLTGAVKAAHAFAPLLRQRNGGTLLFISSVAGQIGS
jgi:NAD(P)-dependent dehydrogenase (short-subunit alcohol dehydrogenase family)